MVKSATGMGSATKDNYVSDAIISFYEALAKGGVGLIMVGNIFIGVKKPYRIDASDDKFIPGLSSLAQVIHEHGCPAFMQLVHSYVGSRILSSQVIAAASPSTQGEYPIPQFGRWKELTILEIQDIVGQFIKAAERVRKAGFDGVEIHACHNDMLNTFLSRAWNKRQDAYGCQDLRSRTRLLVEILQAIKKQVGQDFPCCFKISGAEFGIEKGITSEESQGVAQILQEAGADAIHVSAYGYGDYESIIEPEQILYPEPLESLAKELDVRHQGVGILVPLAAAIKEKVSIPVIALGRLDPFIGEKVLREGKADFISFARRLIADPELPNKVASGRLEDIAPCTACLRCFDTTLCIGKPMECRVNTALMKEREYAIKPAEQKKRVIVVGGGVAGMEAARVAAARGHKVTLYEKERKLGGAMRLAVLVKGVEIEDLMDLIRYFSVQLSKLGVKVRLGKEANLAIVKEIRPDVVILAQGGVPAVLEIPGINRRNVIRIAHIYRIASMYLRFFGPKVLRWLTKIWIPFGEKVVIIGGTIHGCEIAEFLVKRGRKVTIVETSDELGSGMGLFAKASLLRWLARKGAVCFTGVKYERITDKGLVVITKEGNTQTIEADTIVPVMPLRPNTELFKILKAEVAEVYPIGDCREPSLLLEAIADGSHIARAI